MDGTQGVHLTVPVEVPGSSAFDKKLMAGAIPFDGSDKSGGVVVDASATFLPVVSSPQEHAWKGGAEEYMSELSKKAGDETGKAWQQEGATMRTYGSTEFTWHTRQQRLSVH